jgi:ABC-2 type transport system permease protein
MPRVAAALVRRDFLIRRSYKLALILDLVFGLLNLLVYFFISRTFTGAATPHLDGAPSYFAFAVVGIALTVVIGAASTEIANTLREEQLTGTLEALVVQPVTTTQIALGLGGLPFLFAIARAVFYLVVAGVWLGLDFSRTSWIGFASVLLVAGIVMASIGIAAAALVLVIKRGQIVTAITVFGLGLLGGSVFPVSVLPGWLQPLAAIVPTRFAFDGTRAAVFRGTGWGADALVLLALSAICLPAGLALFRQALSFAQRSGSLGQY